MGVIIKQIIVGLAFASVFCSGGYIFYSVGSKPYAEKTLAKLEWPITNATIITSRTDTLQNSNGKLSYGYTLIYEYNVNNKNFSGNNIKPNSRFRWQKTQIFIKTKLKKYTVGSEISILYNPEQPGESFIKPPSKFFTLLIKFLPLLLTLPFGIAVLISQTKGVLKTFRNEY